MEVEKGGGGQGAWKDLWLGGGVLTEGLSGFVLGWAGVGGVIR
jgi:ER membrane protein complex subunit 6